MPRVDTMLLVSHNHFKSAKGICKGKDVCYNSNRCRAQECYMVKRRGNNKIAKTLNKKLNNSISSLADYVEFSNSIVNFSK
jgi:hypothetical protein